MLGIRASYFDFEVDFGNQKVFIGFAAAFGLYLVTKFKDDKLFFILIEAGTELILLN